jgi:hypothetical protein
VVPIGELDCAHSEEIVQAHREIRLGFLLFDLGCLSCADGCGPPCRSGSHPSPRLRNAVQQRLDQAPPTKIVTQALQHAA